MPYRRIIRRLPAGIRTFPMDATFSLLGIPSAAATLVGVTTSRALSGILPTWAVAFWSVCLLVGCTAWLVGILSTREDTQFNTVIIRQAPVMAFGLTLVCSSSLVYAVAILIYGGIAGVLSSLYMFTLFGGTFVRRAELVRRTRET